MNDNAIIRQSINMTDMAASMVAEMSGKIKRLFTEAQIKNISKVIITGCGDSYIAGLAAEEAFKKFSGCGVFPMNTVDATYNIMPRTVKNSTWDSLAIGISVSGSAAGTVKSMQHLKEMGAITLGVTENVNSPLAKNVDYILNHPHAESEVCPGTKTYFSSVITLMLIAIHFGQVKGKLTAEKADEARAQLVAYAQSWKPWLEKIDAQVKELAYMPCFKDAKHFECAGSGNDYVAAWFTRAKIYEAIGTPTTVENTEDWLHVNYFIRKPKENPCIVYATKGSTGESRTMELLDAMVKVGRDVIVITDDDAAKFHEAIHVVQIPEANPTWAAPLLQFMPMTLMCGHLSESTGIPFFRAFAQPWNCDNGIRYVEEK